MKIAYSPAVSAKTVTYRTLSVDRVNIAYREAGDPANPKLVLLHGFPSSSHQYRNLIPALADQFHVIAPDYPGFGNSDVPDPAEFSYTFDHGRSDRALSRAERLYPVWHVRAGLWRPGWFPDRPTETGDAGVAHHTEYQRL